MRLPEKSIYPSLTPLNSALTPLVAFSADILKQLSNRATRWGRCRQTRRMGKERIHRRQCTRTVPKVTSHAARLRRSPCTASTLHQELPTAPVTDRKKRTKSRQIGPSTLPCKHTGRTLTSKLASRSTAYHSCGLDLPRPRQRGRARQATSRKWRLPCVPPPPLHLTTPPIPRRTRGG